MQSKAATVEQYLAELPEERRAAISAVRKVILKSLGKGYEEGMQYGMIGYYVPHRIYPPGYHCDPKQPLPFACLASQKNYMSLYLGCVYGDEGNRKRFKQAWAKTGKKLDMGKSCIRFKKLDDLPLDLIAEEIRRIPVKKWIQIYESALMTMRQRTTKGPPKARSAGSTKTAKTPKPSQPGHRKSRPKK